jgi:hypothetical protein
MPRNYEQNFRIDLIIFVVAGVLRKGLFFLLPLFFLAFSSQSLCQSKVLMADFQHLRQGELAEWSSFPSQPRAADMRIHFTAQANSSEQTLRLRQQDVKQNWPVLLNDQKLGSLTRDENDMVVYLPIPAGLLRTGQNTLYISQSDQVSDDIRVGEVLLDQRPVDQVLGEASIDVEVKDAATGFLLPVRLTVVREEGTLQTVGARSGGQLAIRPGVIYTGSGRASFGLPAGTYTLYASRGFAYGVDSLRINLLPGQQQKQQLRIRQEVLMPGWVSSDTHIHTFTHSGHGDATVEERVLSIAGEGLELPVLTDHNVHVDIRPVVIELGMSPYYTPIMGNEVTTPVGHFNIFPVPTAAAPPDHKVKDWSEVARKLSALPEAKAVVLNHARDMHIGFRPFGPEHHLSPAGRNLEAWTLPANAMEVVNSGATRHDWMQLFHDWFGMLNRGHLLTPVGASDSHDVSRYMVGQGRTYIRSGSTNPGQIDVAEAVQNFRDGKVMVSFGLLAELSVNGRYGPGELAPATDPITVNVRVLGPAWTRADRVVLYANGQKIRESAITTGSAPGVKWSGSWVLPRFPHDVFLVAVAEGPDPALPFWAIAKPYQPLSPEWQGKVFGSSGAVWVDADKDGRLSSAYTYASNLVTRANGNHRQLIRKLASYDEAVAVQVAALLQEQGTTYDSLVVSAALSKAAAATRRGFESFGQAWRLSQQAREVK